MDRPPLDTDEDQDSLFGSPPPSPARGRSPSQETFTPEEVSDATPSTGVSGKNVGTIALPGSHMSCAELPANLPASSLSLPRPNSSHDSSSTAPPTIATAPISVRTPVIQFHSPILSVPSRASSASSTIPSSSSSTRKRKSRKVKSPTPAPPPITLPGPNEPTPPNFLRSQSSLLGLAGLVGSVKPARLYAHGPQPGPIERTHPPSPIRGSTPAHPIVLDDDQDAPHIGKPPIPQRLDQLNPEKLRSNIINSLVKEKNIFPVLESLIKLLGEEPHLPAVPPPQLFARPYGHGIHNAPTSASVTSTSAPGGSMTSAAPLPKRRKLKHVPAGALDWDVPFPFAAGEGPEAYRDTWAQDRVKQLVTQLLELVQNASERAAIKTARGGSKPSEGRTRTSSFQSSRSASVEIQSRGTSSAQSSHSGASPEVGVPSNATPMNSLNYILDSLGALSATDSLDSGCKDRMSVDSRGTEADSADPYDNSAFEEWLSQLQQFVPLETSASTPESDWTRASAPLDSSACSPAQNVHISQSCDPSTSSRTIRDEAIDPALLAISQQSGSTHRACSSTSPTPALPPGDISQTQDVSLIPPILTHSPRTSLSSLTEPLTPLSEAFDDVPASRIAPQDPGCEPHTHRSVEKDRQSPPMSQAQALGLPLKDPPELPRISTAEKGKARADVGVESVAPTVRTSASAASTSQGALDKQAVLERARERRKQLVAEIERAKIEIWTTSIENAVLVHFLREGVDKT